MGHQKHVSDKLILQFWHIPKRTPTHLAHISFLSKITLQKFFPVPIPHL